MLEPIDHQYTLVGTIAASSGVDGTVLIIPEIDAPTLFDDLDLVRLQDARGDLIPARIESVRVQQKNNRLSFFVKFEHIHNRNGAETHKNYRVYLAKDKAQVGKMTSSENDFTSFEVRDQDGDLIGTVGEVIDNPAHPILAVPIDQQQLLIPFVDEYIEAVNPGKAVIHCKNLDQLMDVL